MATTKIILQFRQHTYFYTDSFRSNNVACLYTPLIRIIAMNGVAMEWMDVWTDERTDGWMADGLTVRMGGWQKE